MSQLKNTFYREVEEIQAIKQAESAEEYEEDNHTLITPDIGELLVIGKVVHAKEVPLEPNQMEKIFHTQYTIRGKMCELIIDGGSCTNVAFSKLINKL